MARIRTTVSGALDIELSGDGSQYIIGWEAEGSGDGRRLDFRLALDCLKVNIPAEAREWWEEDKVWVVDVGWDHVLAALFGNWPDAVAQVHGG